MTDTSRPAEAGPLALLAHRAGDDVAVAVRDTEPGQVAGAYLDSGDRFGLVVRAQIPLGHKVALRDLAEGEAVTEYGVPIGRTRRAIGTGELVHTHNIRSVRWQSSV